MVGLVDQYFAIEDFKFRFLYNQTLFFIFNNKRWVQDLDLLFSARTKVSRPVGTSREKGDKGIFINPQMQKKTGLAPMPKFPDFPIKLVGYYTVLPEGWMLIREP